MGTEIAPRHALNDDKPQSHGLRNLSFVFGLDTWFSGLVLEFGLNSWFCFLSVLDFRLDDWFLFWMLVWISDLLV